MLKFRVASLGLASGVFRSQIRTVRATRKYPGPHDRKSKRLDIVMLGKPNCGKSTLLNSMLQKKIAATSRKRQTTKSQILGVFNYRKTQLAFYDTPGFVPSFDAGKEETKRIRDITLSAVSNSDVVLLVVDASKKMSQQDLRGFAEMTTLAFEGARQEVVLVLNKVDLVNPKTELLDLTWDLVSMINGIKLGEANKDDAALDTTTFMVSAIENDGIIDMKNYLLACAKPKHWVIPKGEGISDLSDSDMVEEMLREALLDHMHEEIPYIAGIECQSISELNKKAIRIDAQILVDNNRQQRMVVGDKGRSLVKIRQSTVEILEKIFQKTVLLYIWVNVRSKNSRLNEEPNVL